MTQDEKHAVALMRYGAIAPLISGTKDDFQSLDDYYREAAGKPYPAPDGSTKHFSAASSAKTGRLVMLCSMIRFFANRILIFYYRN